MTGYAVEIRQCQHFKVGGGRCVSPALRGKRYCYYHEQWRPMMLTGTKIVMPLLEDAASIQLAVTQVTHMLINFMIDHKTAALVLSGLRVASSNLKRLQEENAQAAEEARDAGLKRDDSKGKKIDWSKVVLEPEDSEHSEDAETGEVVAGSSAAEAAGGEDCGDDDGQCAGPNSEAGEKAPEEEREHEHEEEREDERGDQREDDRENEREVEHEDEHEVDHEDERLATKPLCAPGVVEPVDPDYTFAASVDRRRAYFAGGQSEERMQEGEGEGEQQFRPALECRRRNLR